MNRLNQPLSWHRTPRRRPRPLAERLLAWGLIVAAAWVLIVAWVMSNV